MTLTCPNCQTRLQLDDDRVPSQPFTVRCPKCQASVKLQAAGEGNQANPATRDMPAEPQFGRQLARQFNPSPDSPASAIDEKGGRTDLDSLTRILAEALKTANGASNGARDKRRTPRKVLVCLPSPSRERVARLLAARNYQVFIAENTAQALGTMREDRMDVLVLDSGFDPD